MVSDVDKRHFSLSARVAWVATPHEGWWIMVVYGPQDDRDKVEFLDELLQFRNSVAGPSMLCGDFNMIYKADAPLPCVPGCHSA